MVELMLTNPFWPTVASKTLSPTLPDVLMVTGADWPSTNRPVVCISATV
jgi:hypothetical protein